MRLFALWGAIGLVLIATSAAAGDMAAGAQLAATCAACHRLDGHASGLPQIAGLEAGKLAEMLQAFKLNAQTSHVMHTVSLTLSDDEIAAVASYLADLGKAKAP